MNHTILYKQDGFYGGFPVLTHLPDGRMTVGIPVAPFHDHYGIGDWVVLVSEDEGETWTETDDPALPYNWPGTSPREKYDRFAAVMPDGSYLCAGSVGWEVCPAERQADAEAQGLSVHPHPADNAAIIVGGNKLFVQRSTDRGQTWERQEWIVPGVHHITAFPRSAWLADGTILVPVYGSDAGAHRRTYVWRSADGGATWRLFPMSTYVPGVDGNETAVLEVSPGRVLAHTRTEQGYLLEVWSDDGGRTWSQPLRTPIWGYPPHLLKLRDGRVLCAFGYRREPMGVRAVLSHDGGKTWDMDNVIILRDDGGTSSQFRRELKRAGSDVGYPISTQLSDGRILTVYYITLADGITHSVATRWAVL
ncbi:MAG: sialidase family protein [Candidatus Poribacteria bacterium]|nr:sialidase family protein [Candidatus Poribacteria bacterium]